MKHILRPIILAIFVSSVGACGSEPVEQTVWDDQIKSMDKARAVEQQLMDQAEQAANQINGIDQNLEKDQKNPHR